MAINTADFSQISNQRPSPFVLIYPGDGSEVWVQVAYIGVIPYNDNSNCAYCDGDPCAENGTAKPEFDTAPIYEYFRRNPDAVTCPICDGRPS